MRCGLGGPAMRRNLDERRERADSPATHPQKDYSLNRLTAAADELSRLTESRLSSAIERALADLDNAVEYSSTGIEAAHKLRLWRADYLRLTAELDAATRSFHLIERELSRRIETALADWERRFEATGSTATAERRTPAVARAGWLRRLLRQHRAQPPPAASEHSRPEQVEVISPFRSSISLPLHHPRFMMLTSRRIYSGLWD